MSESLIAKRYALALFKLALETGQLSGIQRDMAGIGEVLKDSPEFSQTIRNPVLPQSMKQTFISRAFTGKVMDATLKFLNFLVEKKRLRFVPEITAAFLRLEEEHRGVAEAKIITARAVEPDVLKTLDDGLSRKYQKKFAITAEQDPDIIGGFLLYIKDKVYDYSLRHQLKLLREQLLGTQG
jgi:F-type H+-transporting ATPase subunit delta